MDFHKSLITPLNEKNFPTWKIQVKMSLIKDDLWRIVNEEELAPTDPAALNKFNIRKDKALASIVLCIAPKLLYLLGDPVNPVDIWKKLHDIFQKKSWSNKFRLKKKLYDTKLGSNDSLQDHLKCLMEIFDELSVIGDPQKDEDKVICLLSSLPDKFSTLVTALEASENIPSWDTVVERLLHEDSKYCDDVKSQAAVKDNALVMHQSGSGRGKQQHSGNKLSVKCYHCGRSGHLKRNCFQLKNKSNNSNNSNHANTVQSQNDIVLVARNFATVEELNVAGANDLWIADSGASVHMCHEKKLFNNFVETTSSSVEIGDGTALPAKGEGDVLLKMILPNNKIQKVTLKNVLYVPDLNHNLLSVSQCTNNNKKGYVL